MRWLSAVLGRMFRVRRQPVAAISFRSIKRPPVVCIRWHIQATHMFVSSWIPKVSLIVEQPTTVFRKERVVRRSDSCKTKSSGRVRVPQLREKANAKSHGQANVKVNVHALEHRVVDRRGVTIKRGIGSSAVQHFGGRFKCRVVA